MIIYKQVLGSDDMIHPYATILTIATQKDNAFLAVKLDEYITDFK